MGDFKPLMDVGGKPAIIKLITDILSSEVDEVLVVTGHNSDKLISEINSYIENYCDLSNKEDSPNSKELPSTNFVLSPENLSKIDVISKRSKRISTTFNENYIEGMFTSIKCGIKELSSTSDAILLFPVDMPLISSAIINSIIDEGEYFPDEFVVPCFKGKKGHPLLIPSFFCEEIINHPGHGGLKTITQRHDDKMHLFEIDSEVVVIDMDTQNDYSYILKKEKDQNLSSKNNTKNSIGNLNLSGLLSRIILVRHGSTVQHKEKIFLGQSDIPLSEIGKTEASRAATKLSDIGINKASIWSSPLLRAKETAEIISGKLASSKTNNLSEDGDSIKVSFSEELAEINLGEWDGKYISEIKKMFPEEFKKRGEDLLRFKLGNDSENFYDLRYRVLRAFEEILSIEAHNFNDENFSLIIVSHIGPISMIIAEALGINIDDIFDIIVPKAVPLQIDGQLW